MIRIQRGNATKSRAPVLIVKKMIFSTMMHLQLRESRVCCAKYFYFARLQSTVESKTFALEIALSSIVSSKKFNKYLLKRSRFSFGGAPRLTTLSCDPNLYNAKLRNYYP
jgi:hypothetical protein